MASNYNQLPAVILKDLVVDANPNFEEHRDNFEFGAVTVLAEGAQNTSVVLAPTPAQAANYDGSVTVTYNRLGLTAFAEALAGGATVPLDTAPTLTEDSTVAQVVAFLNTRLGLQLAAADLSAATVVSSTTDNVTSLTIEATVVAGHLVFLPGVQDLAFEYREQTDTSTIVTTTVLNGLEYPPQEA